jgi:thiamine-monophosphate kinase
MGEVPIGKALCRDGAKAGDEIWVSGTLGEAALGLAQLQNKLSENALSDTEKQTCIDALQAPQPRVALGLALQGIANSLIDISDGLLADLGHILERSNVGANLYWAQIPHITINKELDTTTLQKLSLAGGDDYELCFTAPQARRDEIIAIGRKLNLRLSTIGLISQERKLSIFDEAQGPIEIKSTGYDHFS